MLRGIQKQSRNLLVIGNWEGGKGDGPTVEHYTSKKNKNKRGMAVPMAPKWANAEMDDVICEEVVRMCIICA
jgi:hypothetical protein